jgi:hypothetical protein
MQNLDALRPIKESIISALQLVPSGNQMWRNILHFIDDFPSKTSIYRGFSQWPAG